MVIAGTVAFSWKPLQQPRNELGQLRILSNCVFVLILTSDFKKRQTKGKREGTHHPARLDMCEAQTVRCST